MKRLVMAVALSLFASEAFAQLSVDKAVDSARAPFSSGVVYAVSVQFEAISATTGKPALSGTATKLPVVSLASAAILADIAGNKGTALTVVALRATFTASGGTGWELAPSVPIRIPFDTPFEIPAGKKVGCRYDMPMQTFDAKTLSFGPPGGGRLRCQPGVLASTIPAAVGAPLPAATPTVALQASPLSVPSGGNATLLWSSTDASGCTASGAWFGSKPASGTQATGALSTTSSFVLGCTGTGGDATASVTVVVTSPPASSGKPSPAGSCITPDSKPTTAGDGCATPLAQLVDLDSAVWSLSTTQALRNGVDTRAALDNFNYWPISYIYVRPSGVLCGFNTNHNDICWTAGKWQ